MEIKLSHCSILVDDKDKAMAFYGDVLGLEVRKDVKLDHVNMRWVELVPPTQPEIEINIFIPEELQGTIEVDHRILRELMAKGVMPGPIFTTDDCDATFEHIRGSGAEVLQEPTDQHHGARDCAFRDPAGNLIRFSQEMESG